MHAAPLLDTRRLDRADTLNGQVPFAFLVARGQLPKDARAVRDRDFPAYATAGSSPHDADECGPSINVLVTALTALGSSAGHRIDAVTHNTAG